MKLGKDVVLRTRRYRQQIRKILNTEYLRKLGGKVPTKLVGQGMPASIGLATIVSGKVRVVKTPQEAEQKVKHGDILVTEMTTPDFVPVMKRASVIITQKGGVSCMAGETRVLTEQGTIPIEQIYTDVIEEGKLIRVLTVNEKTLESEWKFVSSVSKRKRKIWEVMIYSNNKDRINHPNTLKITPEHKMLTFEDLTLVRRPISEIIENEEMVTIIDKIPSSNNNIGFQENTDYNRKLSYLAGAVFSDGHTTQWGGVGFTQSNTENKRKFIQTIKQYFKDIFNTEWSEKVIPPGDVTSIRGRKIHTRQERISLFRLNSDTNIFRELEDCLQQWVLSTHEGNLEEFLGGYIDGDGSLHQSKYPAINIYCDNEWKRQALILACLRLGVLARAEKKEREGDDNSHYVVVINEGLSRITEKCKRVKNLNYLHNDHRYLSAKQLLSNLVTFSHANDYIEKNCLISKTKLQEYIDKNWIVVPEEFHLSLKRIIESPLRMIRVTKIREYEGDVFNLGIEQSNNHNYIIFSSLGTPVLVSNSHAAIVARELRIPAIVGVKGAMDRLKDGRLYYVEVRRGRIYEV